MDLEFKIDDLITFTLKSMNRELQPNEHIIDVHIEQGTLKIKTRLFSEDEPIPGDVIKLRNRDYFLVESFQRGKYVMITLTKDGLTRDHRVSPRTMTIDNVTLNAKIVKRNIERAKVDYSVRGGW